MKILVVEDDLLVAEALRMTLARHNYAVEIANNGRTGLDFIEAFNYDLLLLDVILPQIDGISLCRHVRSKGYMMPILLLTSKDSNHDRAVGLDAGADDYAIKPFDPEDLSARIRALLRRGQDNTQPILTWEQLTLDPRNCEVTYQQQLLALTPKEYALLELFLRHNRRLFSCGAILEHLWTYEDTPSEEAVRTHIKGLRQKLKAVGAPADLVETVYGIGYRLKTGDPAHSPHTPVLAEELAAGIPQARTNSVAKIEPLIPTIAPSRQPPIAKSTAADLPQFLSEIWHRHYDQTIDRVATIEQAITALVDRSLSAQQRLQAKNSAHTLAGTLGTFGLSLGSQAAKQIELSLDVKTDLTLDHIPQLQTSLEDLWRDINSQAQSSPPTIAPPDRDPAPRLLVITSESNLITALIDAAVDRFEIVRATELVPPQLTPTPQLIVLDLDCFADSNTGLAALSTLDRDCPHVPVLVLSQPTGSIETAPINGIAAHADSRLIHRIEVARRGGRMFLLKPISPRQILVAVDRVLQQVSTHRASILIVDDDRLLLEGLTALLSPVGMQVTTLSEPSQFWKTLEACQPDLLILDLDMPMHSGIELCQAVRVDPHWANLPIMFLTAHTAALAIDRVFAAGADDFVTKPVVAAALVTRIVNRLERIGLQRSSIII